MTYCVEYPCRKPRRFYEDTAKEYKKRLSRYCKVQSPIKVNPVDDRDMVIAVSPDGMKISSEEMAKRLGQAESGGDIARVIFILSPDITVRSNEKWALTQFDIPIDLQLVLILEQLYRAQKILHNEPYHK